MTPTVFSIALISHIERNLLAIPTKNKPVRLSYTFQIQPLPTFPFSRQRQQRVIAANILAGLEPSTDFGEARYPVCETQITLQFSLNPTYVYENTGPVLSHAIFRQLPRD
jgi:hypothetical protein